MSLWKYHVWMLNEELRTLTASEPLSLEEEYDMQRKWQVDEDKLTFIILAREHDINVAANKPQKDIEPMDVLCPTDPRITSLPMVGDVNLFLHGVLSSLRGNNESDNDDSRLGEGDDTFEAEVEIMIAEPAYRLKGLALETLQLMLTYVTGNAGAFSVSQEEPLNVPEKLISPLKIPPSSLLARITETNMPSIHLFEKLGFKVTKRVEVFQEVEMRWRR